MLILVLEQVPWCCGIGELIEEHCDASHYFFHVLVYGYHRDGHLLFWPMVLAIFSMTVSAYVLVHRVAAEV